MDFDLSEEQLAIRQMVREFAEKEIAPRAEEMDATGEFPTQIIRQLGQLGLMGLPFPERYGGSGADFLSYVLAIEELARVDGSVAVTVAVAVSLAGMPIYLFGTEEQKDRWLVPICRGEMVGAFGLTEPHGGSDAGNSTTTARLDGDHWVINGTKVFITNAGNDLSGFVVMTACTGTRPDGRKEISAFIVPKGTPGYTFSKPYRKMGWRASDTRELSFVDCRVPQEHMLGPRGAGFREFLTTLDNGRIVIAAMGLGLAQGALEMSVKYARERVVFGQPIANYQAIQHKLADMATEIELARLLTYKAAVLKDQGKPFVKEASMAKLYTSELAVRAADAGVQIHGGYGWMDEFPISRFYRDAKVLTIAEGTSEIQRGIIARHVLGLTEASAPAAATGGRP